MSSNTTIKKIDRKDLKSVLIRGFAYNSSFNYERQLQLGWAWTIMPVLRKLYKDDDEQMSLALQRHLVFNNITPFISTILFGITIAMEEQNAADPDFDTDSINAVKVSLMGPLSAIGDTIFFSTIRTIAASIGCSMAIEGNVMGPIIYLLIFNIPNVMSRYYFIFKGYELGTGFLTSVEKSGVVDKVFKGTGILGLMVMGAMVGSNVGFPIAISYDTFDLFTVTNSIIPNLTSLIFTGVIFWLIRKDVKIVNLILGIMLFAIAGAFIGIF